MEREQNNVIQGNFGQIEEIDGVSINLSQLPTWELGILINQATARYETARDDLMVLQDFQKRRYEGNS